MTRIHTMVVCLVVMLLVIGVFGCRAGAPPPTTSGKPVTSSAPITLRMHSEEAPKDTSIKHLWAKNFKELCEQRSQGRLKVEYFSSGQLYTDAEALVAVSEGTLDVAVTSQGVLASYAPKSVVLELYGLILTREQGVAFLKSSKMRKEILEPLEQRGMHANLLSTQPSKLWTKKPINSVSDLKGLKLRTMPSKALTAGAKSLGLSPIAIPTSEMYTALQQGTIDAINTGDLTVRTQSLHEILKNCLDNPATNMSGIAHIISSKVLAKLPADIRAIVEQADSDAEQVAIDTFLSGINKKIREDLIAGGVKFTELSPDEKQKFYDLSKASWADFVNVVGQDLIDEAVKLRK